MSEFIDLLSATRVTADPRSVTLRRNAGDVVITAVITQTKQVVTVEKKIRQYS